MISQSRMRLFVALGLAGIVGLALFPPWHRSFRWRDIGCGYSFIALPPEGCRIDAIRLLVEWVAVVSTTLICALLLRAKWTSKWIRFDDGDALQNDRSERASGGSTVPRPSPEA